MIRLGFLVSPFKVYITIKIILTKAFITYELLTLGYNVAVQCLLIPMPCSWLSTIQKLIILQKIVLYKTITGLEFDNVVIACQF